MYISINLSDKGETKLFLQPQSKEEDNKEFILIASVEDIENPYVRLRLKDNRFDVEEKRDIDEADDVFESKLDELALEVIAAQQRGDDIADANLNAQIKPYDPDKIRVESKNF